MGVNETDRDFWRVLGPQIKNVSQAMKSCSSPKHCRFVVIVPSIIDDEDALKVIVAHFRNRYWMFPVAAPTVVFA